MIHTPTEQYRKSYESLDFKYVRIVSKKTTSELTQRSVHRVRPRELGRVCCEATGVPHSFRKCVFQRAGQVTQQVSYASDTPECFELVPFGAKV